jgi:hypothetical protein
MRCCEAFLFLIPLQIFTTDTLTKQSFEFMVGGNLLIQNLPPPLLDATISWVFVGSDPELAALDEP